MDRTRAPLILVPALLAALTATACTTTPSDPVPEAVDRLLVIDTTSAATMRPDGTDRVDLDPGDGARFFQGTWSSDATRMALSGQAPEGPFLDIYPPAEPTSVRLATASLPFYLYWEPGGDRVAYLANGDAGIDLRLVTDDPDGPSEDLIGTGQPYYFDWAPAGGRLAVHVGASRLEILSPGETSDSVLTDPAPYQAPQWSPDGSRILHAVTGDRRRVVLTAPGEGDGEAVDTYDGVAYFAMDPTGSRVAIASLGGESGPVVTASRRVTEPDTLVVVDLDDGGTTTVGGEPSVGFWWSPQGDALLFLTVDDPGADGPRLRWHVWDSGVVNDLERFTPSGTFARDLLPFFDQYARSMTLWSPDGTRFAYPGAPDGEAAGIWVRDLVTGARDRVADGGFVAWSPR